VKDPEEFYGSLRETGVCFQVTINSFGGFYGRDAMEKAHWLANRGWIDILGSDLHSRRHVQFHRQTLQKIDFERLCEKNQIINDYLITN
jgi:tyrosine-protein phosphatase YwqE